MKSLKYLHIYLPVLLFLWIGLFLDSLFVAKHFEHGQLSTTVLALPVFTWVYLNVSKQVKQLMLFGIIVAALGEVVFSLLLGMYTYRLDNVPLYVPLGHSLVYACVYYIVKEPLVQKHQESIMKFLYIVMLLYSSAWLLFANDMFGFIATVVIVILFKKYYTTKLFFLIMYFMIVYLELLGTHYGAWIWPDVWFDKIAFITSANPPSGISAFYFGFDAGCLWFYKHYDSHRWARFRAYRKREKDI